MTTRHQHPCATDYLIDLKHAVIMDVEATTAVRQAEVGAARTMIERTQDRFGAPPTFPQAQRGRRSIGTSVGDEPTWIAPSGSKPWRR